MIMMLLHAGDLLRGPVGGQGLSRDRASAHGGRVIIVAASVRGGAAGVARAELHEARDPGVPGVLALALLALLAVVPLKVTLRPLKVPQGNYTIGYLTPIQDMQLYHAEKIRVKQVRLILFSWQIL